MGARDVQGLPPLAQPAPRQSYAPMAGMGGGGGRDGGKKMIQRLNEENGRHENTVLNTWRRCKQG